MLMGLAEKRLIKQYQDGSFIKLQAEMAALVGKPIPFEVDWASLPQDESAGHLVEALDKIYFLPILEAVKALCLDDSNKETLAKGLCKIIVTNGEKSEQDISFGNGVLTVNQNLSNIDADYEKRVQKITEALEGGLGEEASAVSVKEAGNAVDAETNGREETEEEDENEVPPVEEMLIN
jgi:hypothetical protein